MAMVQRRTMRTRGLGEVRGGRVRMVALLIERLLFALMVSSEMEGQPL
jgi:hypothetical protein